MAYSCFDLVFVGSDLRRIHVNAAVDNPTWRIADGNGNAPFEATKGKWRRNSEATELRSAQDELIATISLLDPVNVNSGAKVDLTIVGAGATHRVEVAPVVLFECQTRHGRRIALSDLSEEISRLKDGAAAPDIILTAADLVGPAFLADFGIWPQGRICFDSSFVERINLTNSNGVASVRVALSLPGPIPHSAFGNQPWNVTLLIDSATASWGVEEATVPWVKGQNKKLAKGALGAWLRKLKSGTPRIELEHEFPCSELGWTADNLGSTSVRVGLAAPVSEPGMPRWLSLICALATENLAGKTTYLIAQHLQTGEVGVLASAGRLVVALVGTFRTGNVTSGGPWMGVFQWAVAAEGSTKHPLARAMGLAWNHPARFGLLGTRLLAAGMPFVPLPLVSGPANWSVDRARWHRLVTAVPIRRGEVPRVLRLDYETSAADKFDLRFDWFAGQTSPHNGVEAITESTRPPLIPRALLLRGMLKESGPALKPVSNSDFAAAAKVIEAAQILAPDAELPLVEWELTNWTVEFGANRWARFGALEICADAANGESHPYPIRHELRGSWEAYPSDPSAASNAPREPPRCDCYPEFHLPRLPCKVRLSAKGDRLPDELMARFDTAGVLEDRLQRPSSPIVASVGADNVGSATAIDASLSIRVRAEPGRSAVIELRLSREPREKKRPEGAFYFRQRPFEMSLTGPPEFDEEGGLDIAVWRSDDPDGPQWRIPAATVSVTMPAQGVAEEHERGSRFWDKGSDPGSPNPYIDPTEPLLFRFTPPTTVVVRPGTKERRYNKSASNLGSVLQRSRVQSFSTEVLYPIQMSFQRDANDEPPIEIAESSEFFGRPAVNLPRFPDARNGWNDRAAESARLAFLRDVFPDDLATWFNQNQSEPTGELTPDGERAFEELRTAFQSIRWQHAAHRAQFVARVAQHHLIDPYKPGRQLQLRKGLVARLRKPIQFELEAPNELGKPTRQAIGTRYRVECGSLPPLLRPLPGDLDLTAEEKASPRVADAPSETHEFLQSAWSGDSAKPEKDWAPPHSNGAPTGAIRAGALHTMEFASELQSVLRDTQGSDPFIDQLAFSAIGATGAASVSFDEGRTTFSVEIADGLVWRIRKIRIGRLAVLWNKAQHVVVYERTVAPSQQFQSEQPQPATHGWPILRKTEEYVEPLEPIRQFAKEVNAADNSTAFGEGSEIVTPRIYVNGAWGRDCMLPGDVRHGYEIPLWNPRDRSGFYPKPALSLRNHAGGGEVSRAWFQDPEELYFYSNTQVATGNDPDAWAAMPGVDTVAAGPMRLPLLCNQGDEWKDGEAVLDAPSVPAATLESRRRPRFDLRVRTDGPVNLQQGRGDNEMLAASLDLVSLARTSEAEAVELPRLKTNTQFALAATLAAKRAELGNLEEELRRLIADVPALFAQMQFSCDKLEESLRGRIDHVFRRIDDASRDLFAAPLPLPQVDAERLKEEFLGTHLDWALPKAPVIEAAAKVLRASVERALLLSDLALVDQRAHIEDAFAELNRRIELSQSQFLEGTVSAAAQAQHEWEPVVRTVSALLVQLEQELLGAAPWTVATLRPALTALHLNCDAVERALASCNVPLVMGLAQRVRGAVDALRTLADDGSAVLDNFPNVIPPPLATALQTLGDRLRAPMRAVSDDIREVCAAATVWLDQVAQTSVAVGAEIEALLDDISAALAAENWSDATAAKKATEAIRDALAAAEGQETAVHSAVDSWRDALRGECTSAAGNLFEQLAREANRVAELLTEIRAQIRHLLEELLKGVPDAIQFSLRLHEQKRKVDALVGRIAAECKNGVQTLDRVCASVRDALRQAADELSQKVTRSVGTLVDDATRREFEAAIGELGGGVVTVGKGLKLVKALGELPKLPQLDFNTLRAEYLFQDLQKQIKTSPFAAKLRELDSGLKDLGIAIPTRELMDQLVPEDLKADFNKVFRDLGGIDFRKLFQAFKLPGLDRSHIKITHGVDSASRTAWAKTTVSADYPESKELFGMSALSVQLSQMSLRADSGFRIALDGARRVETTGSLRGNWEVRMGGAALVGFRDVTVRFDGGNFNVDIQPEKIELHPSLKFLSNVAKTLGEKIPPNVELVRDGRGAVVGAKSSFSTIVRGPIGAPPVTLGGFSIQSGLSLSLEKGAGFVVAASVGVGSKTAPVFVQIGILGGGVWVDAEARFIDGVVRYVGNVGLSLGNQQTFNLGGVARGSFSLLLFAYGSFEDQRGGSLRAGLSIEGSARILGLINAYVLLLLEVIHQASQSRGTGLLRVEVEIGRFYKIKVRKQVEKKL